MSSMTLRQASASDWRWLQRELWLWNPLRLLPSRDEYDCLVAPVLRELEHSGSYVGVAAALTRALNEHFGARADRQELMLFAAGVVERFAAEQSR